VTIQQIQTIPPDSTLSIGDTLQLWVDALGSDLEYHWAASTGRFLETSTYYARWKAPGTPIIARITVIAANDQGSATAAITVPVGSYLPRHEPAYAGAAYCGLECHSVTGHGDLYDRWVQTAHARAYASVAAAPTACAECHTVGYADVDSAGHVRHNGGFDEVPVDDLAGVQCESCHGPLADRYGEKLPDHAQRALGDFLLATGTPAAPTGCAACHEPFGKPYLSEWATSAHARSPEPAGAADPPCARCHTAQGFVVYAQSGGTLESPPDDPLAITCAACHDPHGGRELADLRDGPGGDVCRLCHADEEGFPAAPHAPQADMLAGTGGYEIPGGDYASSPHRNLLGEGCATCHYPTGGASISHAFGADDQSCLACHPEASGSGFAWSTPMTEIQHLLTELHDELQAASAADSLRPEFQQADFDYHFVRQDGSSGAHNYKYARGLLQAALDAFEPASGR
jgi:predicted CXXCH cytochrome family protein